MKNRGYRCKSCGHFIPHSKMFSTACPKCSSECEIVYPIPFEIVASFVRVPKRIFRSLKRSKLFKRQKIYKPQTKGVPTKGKISEKLVADIDLSSTVQDTFRVSSDSRRVAYYIQRATDESSL
jgi:hypothetical protein